jgi:thiol-disulfide isomerase/thioredoxin
MTFKKSHISNLLFVIVITLMIIPQTRKPIQVGLHSIVALFSPLAIDKEDQLLLSNYDWQLLDSNSTIFTLEKAKGKVLFVNLWATWCPPCIAEMPSMQKIYDAYGDRVVFLFISNENQEKVTAFLKRKNRSIPSYYPLSSSPKDIASNSIPATYIIDKKGFIVVEKIGAANWNSTSVRKLLDNLLLEE